MRPNPSGPTKIPAKRNPVIRGRWSLVNIFPISLAAIESIKNTDKVIRRDCGEVKSIKFDSGKIYQL
jgi:hypothetical protein